LNQRYGIGLFVIGFLGGGGFKRVNQQQEKDETSEDFDGHRGFQRFRDFKKNSYYFRYLALVLSMFFG
jgi:hypothetical protein